MLPEVIAEKRQTILESLEAGCSVLAACEGADLSTTSYYRWLRKSEEFLEAVTEVQKSRARVVEDSLFQYATTGGKSAVTACIFWLCNRAPERWQHVQTVKHEGRPNSITVVFNDKEAPRALAERLRAEVLPVRDVQALPEPVPVKSEGNGPGRSEMSP